LLHTPEDRVSKKDLDLACGFKDYGFCMRISELAEQAGVMASTVRYYERIGLMQPPSRTDSGYRSYDEADAARLVFITRAKRLGLTLEQIAELLPVWDGVNCGATHEQITQLVDAKRVEVQNRIHELQQFAEHLDAVRDALLESPPPVGCLPDLSCCMPAADSVEAVPVTLSPARPHSAT
jgi:DNA-binding transcriptional MerR regulator